MPKYETMLITSTTLDEEAAAAVVGKFKDLIEKHGTIEAVDEWGRRRLAYPINKEIDGVYTLVYFEAPADFPAELDRVYKITDGVLRSLIIARDPDAPVPEIKAKEAAPVAPVAPAEKAEEPKEVAPVTPAEEAEEPKAEAPAEEEPKAEPEAETKAEEEPKSEEA